MGWGSRASVSNYVFNHIGNFGAAGEAICRALLFAGVPVRHPELRFAFLEGGVNWACGLYSDFIGHREKRNREEIWRYDPGAIDRARLRDLFAEYAPKCVHERLGDLDEALLPLSNPDEPEHARDEFAASGIEGPEHVKSIFEDRFFFGCEADDPLNATAFDSRTKLLGATLNAIYSSDIGHWDVPDMGEVVPEAWELVEKGLLDEAQFRAFVFDNPVALWTGTNPDFFRGTQVESAVASISGRPRA
jgi:hypothetical protein